MIATLLLAATLSISSDGSGTIRFQKAPQPKNMTCGIRVVGYRFHGEAGQTFTYAGKVYTIPAARTLEIVATKKQLSYSRNGVAVQLGNSPLDAFGFEDAYLGAATNQLNGEQS